MIRADTSGLKALQNRIAAIQSKWDSTVQEALDTVATNIVANLSNASPKGSGSGDTVKDDAPGPLSSSFASQHAPSAYGGTVSVYTVQPNKLQFVRYGTGVFGPLGHRIYPVRARALYWQGAAHPYRSIAGQKPNDFVSPVIDASLPEFQQAVSQAVHDLMQEELL